MRNVDSPLYCSIDLELSGFDPSKAEILEVGLVFFKPHAGKLQITEEWRTMVKPSRPVPQNILGLTGISETELIEAPEWLSVKDIIQDKLKDAIIVGHSVSLDMRFLEAFGIKLLGKFIDTLELAQIFLPTHHSYNLENLMHYFAISHREAHRALADARAGMYLLERLLARFATYDSKLQKKIITIVGQAGFLWFDALNWGIKAEKVAKPKMVLPKILKTSPSPLPSQALYNFSFTKDVLQEAALLVNGKKKVIIAVPDSKSVLSLAKMGVAEPIFSPADSFDVAAFDRLLKKKGRTTLETLFLLKVMVWQHTNWQTKTHRDLNAHFSGGQFMPLLSAKKVVIPRKNVAVCDLLTLLENQKLISESYETVVIVDVFQFENVLENQLGEKVSWGYISYLLKSIYNPETNSGNNKFKQHIIDGLAASDLFFGLFVLFLKAKSYETNFTPIDDVDSYQFQKIRKAAENYEKKLTAIAKVTRSRELKRVIAALHDYFSARPGQVQWLESGESYCILRSTPIDLRPSTQKLFKKFKKTIFVDQELSSNVVSAYQKRFGLEEFTFIQAKNFALPKIKTQITQVDLEKLAQKSELPAVILFNNALEVRKFYEAHHGVLKKRGALLAQEVTGGSTKIFRNFSINKDSLLLTTPAFILKNPWVRLVVHTLIYKSIGNPRRNHPYIKAVNNFMAQYGINFPLALEENAKRLVFRSVFSKKLSEVKQLE